MRSCMVLNPTSHTFAYGGASASLQYHQNFEPKGDLDDMRPFLLGMRKTELAGAFATWLGNTTFPGTLCSMRTPRAISHHNVDSIRTMISFLHPLYLLTICLLALLRPPLPLPIPNPSLSRSLRSLTLFIPEMLLLEPRAL